MNVTGIIAEYNPFHNGHAFHIEETRKNTDLKKEIDGRLQQEDQTYFTVVTFDRNFIS